MKIGYFEVTGGCAGDMLVASLLDAGLDEAALQRELKKVPLRGYRVEVRKVRRETGHGHAIPATVFQVTPRAGAWDDHTPYRNIVRMIAGSKLAAGTKRKILGIFDILADAESLVHGEPKSKLHFHQVGQVDAIVEVAAAVIGTELLGLERVVCSRIGLGNPAPATQQMTLGVPVLLTGAGVETATPTGVAILRGLCAEIGARPACVVERVGTGAGTRAEPAPNVVRLFIGIGQPAADRVTVLEATLDDLNPLFLERAVERCFAEGALDVTVVPGQGKKGRPVFQVTVLCPEDRLLAVAGAMFAETTTLGLRWRTEERLVLARDFLRVETPWGSVSVKVGYRDGQAVNRMPEYDDCLKIARKHGIPLKRVYQEVLRRAGAPGGTGRRG